MATPSTAITFTTAESISAKNITLTDTSPTYDSGELSWPTASNGIVVKIVDPQSTVFRPAPAVTSPDITGGGNSVSLNLPLDGDLNVIRGSYNVTLTYFDIANTTATSFDATTVATNAIAIANVFNFGQSIIYSAAGGTKIPELTDGAEYFICNTTTSSSIKLSTTESNALTGVVLGITNGSGATGTQTFTASQYDRTYQFNNSYASPTIDLDLSYSVINPIGFNSTDNTDYGYNTVIPTLAYVHTLTHPQGNGSYVVTTRTLNTKVFYYSTDPDITSVIGMVTTATYSFTGYYTDVTGTNVGWDLVDIIGGNRGIYVSGGSDGCDLFCCMKALEMRLDDAISSGNTTNETRLTKLFNRASNLWQLVQKAYDCGKSSDAASYTAEIKDLLDCDGDCSSAGTVSQVVGIGTTPDIARLGSATMTANVTSYVFTGLIGYNYSDGDVIISLDGENLASSSSYNVSLNSITGEVTFGATAFSGVKVSYHIIKP